MEDIDQLLKKSIKALLVQLAARSDNPSQDLELILQEALQELYDEGQKALEASRRSHLKLIAGASSADG